MKSTESNLVLVGVSHKATPVEIREKLAFNQVKLEASLEQLVRCPEIVENIILSTCNRVEIYARVENTDQGIQLLKDFICVDEAKNRVCARPMYTF